MAFGIGAALGSLFPKERSKILGDFRLETPGQRKRRELSDKIQVPDLPEISTSALDQARQRIQGVQAPQQLSQLQAQTESRQQGPLPEFQALRDRAQKDIREQAQRAGQQQQEALKRRFARFGGLQSGAFIKQSGLAEQRLQEQAGQAEQRALENIGFQEAQQQRQLDEATRARNLQRELQAQQINAQRDIYNSDANFRTQVFQADAFSKLAQMDLQLQQLGQDRLVNEFNLQLSEVLAKNPKPGLVGGILEDLTGVFQ